MPERACERCGRLCRAGVSSNPAARPFRKADKGLCIDCAVTSFVLGVETIAWGIERNGPTVLLDPRVHDQFAALMRVGESDASPEEINWQRVVGNWSLPLPKRKRR